MTNIFNSVSNLVKFNNDGNDKIGVDDMMPIINYTIIKAQPKWFFQYVNLWKYTLEKKKKKKRIMN